MKDNTKLPKLIDLSRRFICLDMQQGRLRKDGLECYVRKGCDAPGIHGTAACEFVNIKRLLGFTEIEVRKELAQWLGHNPQRAEVMYVYVP